MFCWGCIFAPLSHKFWKWRSQNCPHGTSGAHWLLACSGLWVGKLSGKSHAKNNFVFHRNSRSCNGCFDWCIGFLNCTGTSVQWQNESIIIMKMGTGQLAPLRWTNENLFLTWAAVHSRCRMVWNRNQMNYLRIFATQPVVKKCQDSPASETDARLPAVTVRRCTSTSCHGATMPILAMFLIVRCNWNGKSFFPQCPPPFFSQMFPLFQEPWDIVPSLWNFSAEHCNSLWLHNLTPYKYTRQKKKTTCTVGFSIFWY